MHRPAHESSTSGKEGGKCVLFLPNFEGAISVAREFGSGGLTVVEGIIGEGETVEEK